MKPILILGANGKTGRRVAERLEKLGVPFRPAGRSTTPPFDWTDRSTWRQAVEGTSAIYVTNQPDLAIPGAREATSALTDLALAMGVKRVVLLSGRGEEEALAAEKALMASGADWTILSCSWFNQNFSEGHFFPDIMSGEVALPVGGVGEPFVDADDIADVAVKALTEDGHVGKLYELTGPRFLTFAQAVQEIAAASGRDITFRTISHKEFKRGVEALRLPKDLVWLLDELFTRVLDGRNEYLADGVQQALGRPAKDFSAFAREAAATGVWNV
jgi:uncharacterized protein YbjT (DUF2867 family)